MKLEIVGDHNRINEASQMTNCNRQLQSTKNTPENVFNVLLLTTVFGTLFCAGVRRVRNFSLDPHQAVHGARDYMKGTFGVDACFVPFSSRPAHEERQWQQVLYAHSVMHGTDKC